MPGIVPIPEVTKVRKIRFLASEDVRAEREDKALG